MMAMNVLWRRQRGRQPWSFVVSLTLFSSHPPLLMVPSAASCPQRFYATPRRRTRFPQTQRQPDPETSRVGTIEQVHTDHWEVAVDGIGPAIVPEAHWLWNPVVGKRAQFYPLENSESNAGKPQVALTPCGRKSVKDCEAQLKLYFGRHRNLIGLTPNSPPEEIQNVLGMSKRQFKSAVNKLLNEKRIIVFPDCMSYVGKASKNENTAVDRQQRPLALKHKQAKISREKNLMISAEHHYGLDKGSNKKNQRKLKPPVARSVIDSGDGQSKSLKKRLSSVDHAKKLGRGSTFTELGKFAATHVDVPLVWNDLDKNRRPNTGQNRAKEEEDVYSDDEAPLEAWETSSAPMTKEEWDSKESSVAGKYGYQILPTRSEGDTMEGRQEEKQIEQKVSYKANREVAANQDSRKNRKRESTSSRQKQKETFSDIDRKLFDADSSLEVVVDEDEDDIAFFQKELGEKFGGYADIQSDDEETVENLRHAEHSPFMSHRKLRQIQRQVHRNQVDHLNQ